MKKAPGGLRFVGRTPVHPLSATSARRRTGGAPVLLCLLASSFLFWDLGYTGLAARDEANYSEPAREMLVSHDWLVPRRNGVPRLNKPPLTYWALVGLYRLFGLKAWAGRLLSAGSALATVALLVWWVGRSTASASAWWVGVALSSSPFFLAEAHVTTTDMFLCFWLTAAVIAGFEGLQGPRPRALPVLLFFVAAGAGTLTKGPVALALPGLIVLISSAAGNRWRRIHWPAFAGGWAVYALLSVPWFVLLEQAEPGAVKTFFLRENISRFATGVDHSAAPVWYFVPVLLLAVLPWTSLLPSAVWRPIRLLQTSRDSDAAALVVPATVWWVTPFVLFSVSATKLVSYVLPCIPPLAILLGMVLNDRWQENHPPSRGPVWLYLQGAFLGVLGTAMIVLPARLAEVPATVLTAPRLVGGTLTLLGGVVVVLGTARWGVRAGISCLLVAHLLFCGSVLRLFAALEPYKGVRPLAKELRTYGAPEVSVVSWHIPEPGVAFYLRKIVPQYDESRMSELRAKVRREGRVLCLVGPGQESALAHEPSWAMRRLGGNQEATIVELTARPRSTKEPPP